MNRPYPHEALVLDWFHGVAIQYKEDGTWKDLPAPNLADKMPHFYVTGEYRRKPRIVRWRVADMASGTPALVRNSVEEFNLQNSPAFCGWLCDWVEVTK